MKLGLLAGVEANPEHAEQVEAILRNAVELATQEQNTVSRLSFHESATTVRVFNTVADDQLGYAPEPVRPQDISNTNASARRRDTARAARIHLAFCHPERTMT